MQGRQDRYLKDLTDTSPPVRLLPALLYALLPDAEGPYLNRPSSCGRPSPLSTFCPAELIHSATYDPERDMLLACLAATCLTYAGKGGVDEGRGEGLGVLLLLVWCALHVCRHVLSPSSVPPQLEPACSHMHTAFATSCLHVYSRSDEEAAGAVCPWEEAGARGAWRTSRVSSSSSESPSDTSRAWWPEMLHRLLGVEPACASTPATKQNVKR